MPHGYDVSYLYALTVLVAAFSGRRVVVVRTMFGVWLLSVTAFAIKHHNHTHSFTATEIFSRVMAAVIIALIVVVVSAVMTRESENGALGRALRDAEGDREVDKRMLAAASAVTTIGTWSLDVNDDRFDWSDEAAGMHGFPAGHRPLRDEVLSLMSADDAARLRRCLEVAEETGDPFREELQIQLPDGSHRWIVKMGETIRREDGTVARLHGTVQDITRWKQAELAASSESNRFSQLTQSLPIIVWTATAQGTVDYVNEALERFTGLTAAELVSGGTRSVIHPDDLERVLLNVSTAVARGDRYDVDYRVRRADGEYLWHHSSGQSERNDAGEVIKWWGSAIDIDANRRLREDAEALAAEREMVLETMVEGVYVLDRDWTFLYVNSSAERILGFSRKALVGTTLWDAFPFLEGSELHDQILKTLELGAPDRFTYHAVDFDKWLEISITPNPVGATAFFHDVTEVRRLSQQVAQSQRLEAIGQLTGGIAHDFNNLLTVVLGGADALTSDDALTDESREMAELIGSAAERGAELTHRLLAFARRQPLEPQVVNLSERLHKLEPLLRRTLGQDISIAVLPEGNALAEVDPGQFENALLNLAINARDAMPRGGTLTIEVRSITLDEAYVTADSSVTPGKYVVVTVTDSGAGVDPKDLGHLFDPFFTTKEISNGSGLGLAMVWGFVKQSGGHITVYSEPGYGTSFKMYLPAALSAPVPSGQPSTQISTRAASGTILLVEDDDLVRVFATDRLRAKGYVVIAAASGPEALQALESMENIDLLFTDVKMPGGMTGRELATEVVARRPATPVLYASGYTEDVIMHNDRLDPGVNLLAKPYSTRQLIGRVGDLLAAAQQAIP